MALWSNMRTTSRRSLIRHTLEQTASNQFLSSEPFARISPRAYNDHRISRCFRPLPPSSPQALACAARFSAETAVIIGAASSSTGVLRVPGVSLRYEGQSENRLRNGVGDKTESGTVLVQYCSRRFIRAHARACATNTVGRLATSLTKERHQKLTAVGATRPAA